VRARTALNTKASNNIVEVSITLIDHQRQKNFSKFDKIDKIHKNISGAENFSLSESEKIILMHSLLLEIILARFRSLSFSLLLYVVD